MSSRRNKQGLVHLARARGSQITGRSVVGYTQGAASLAWLPTHRQSPRRAPVSRQPKQPRGSEPYNRQTPGPSQRPITRWGRGLASAWHTHQLTLFNWDPSPDEEGTVLPLRPPLSLPLVSRCPLRVCSGPAAMGPVERGPGAAFGLHCSGGDGQERVRPRRPEVLTEGKFGGESPGAVLSSSARCIRGVLRESRHQSLLFRSVL